MTKIYSIYKATNIITNKCYIGFDSKWPNRKNCHKRDYQNPKYNTKFYNSIRKYGWENFKWELLYQSYLQDHTLNIIEPHFIQENNSFVDGYNMTIGGERGPVLNGNLNGMFGKTHTKQTRKKLAHLAEQRFKNKTYEDLYGKEKSITLKKIRSKIFKNIDRSGKNNPRYDHNIYTFKNIKSNEIFIGDRLSFHQKFNVSKPSISEIIKKHISRRNWIII